MRALDQPLYATDPVVWNRLPGWTIGLSTASPGMIDNANSCHGQLLPGGPQSSKVLGGGSFLHARSQTEVRVSDSSRAAHCASRRRPLSATYLFGASTLMIFGTMKVLVVGATGYLGSRIAVESARRGHKVTALVSEGSQSKKADIVQRLRDAGIEICYWTLGIKAGASRQAPHGRQHRECLLQQLPHQKMLYTSWNGLYHQIRKRAGLSQDGLLSRSIWLGPR